MKIKPLVAIIAVLFLGLLSYFYFKSPTSSHSLLARIVSHEGQVRLKRAGEPGTQSLESQTELREQDGVVTDINSKIVLEMGVGTQVEFGPETRLVIESHPQSPEIAVIQLQRGTFQVLKSGAPGRVLISQNEGIFDLAGRPIQSSLAIKQEEVKVESPSPSEQEPVSQPDMTKSTETLSDEYIASIVRSQKSFFNRCFAEYLQKFPQGNGRINLTFTIQQNGDVSQVNLLSSTFKNERLQQCTMAVIERCRFRPFSGAPIVINYPISFD